MRRKGEVRPDTLSNVRRRWGSYRGLQSAEDSMVFVHVFFIQNDKCGWSTRVEWCEKKKG